MTKLICRKAVYIFLQRNGYYYLLVACGLTVYGHLRQFSSFIPSNGQINAGARFSACHVCYIPYQLSWGGGGGGILVSPWLSVHLCRKVVSVQHLLFLLTYDIYHMY